MIYILYLKYLITLIKHKYYVFLACKDCGLFYRGLLHDLSKFSLKEFVPYAQYFQGVHTFKERELAEYNFRYAWNYHKNRNSHHWEFWIEFKEGIPFPLKMPYWDLVEMICDWVGAGRVYNKENWSEAEPLQFFEKNRNKIRLHEDTFKFLELVLLYLSTNGWTFVSRNLKNKLFEY